MVALPRSTVLCDKGVVCAGLWCPAHTRPPESDGAFAQSFQEHPQSVLLTESLKPTLQQRHPDGRYTIGQDILEQERERTEHLRNHLRSLGYNPDEWETDAQENGTDKANG